MILLHLKMRIKKVQGAVVQPMLLYSKMLTVACFCKRHAR